MKRFIKNESGAAAVVVALVFVALVGISALVIDYGDIANGKRELQNAVDSASLAAAQYLPCDTNKAASKAEEYVELNVQGADVTGVVFTDGNRKVTVTATRVVSYLFARAFEANSGTTVTTNASAIATNVFGPYDYAIFSGSDIDLLQFTGQNYIVGDVHSNYNIKNAATVIGTVTAVGTIDGKIDADLKIPGYDPISMPDFSNVVEAATTLTSEVILSYGATYSSGTYTLSPANLNNLLDAYSNKTIYINGNLKIDGSGVCAKGCVIVTGNITFNGGNVDMGTGNAICLASLHGNITFNGGDGDVTGILYAPEGTVTLDGKSGIFSGSIIAETVDSNGGITIYYNPDAQNSVPITEIKLVD